MSLWGQSQPIMRGAQNLPPSHLLHRCLITGRYARRGTQKERRYFSDLHNRAQGKFTGKMWLEVGSVINARLPPPQGHLFAEISFG